MIAFTLIIVDRSTQISQIVKKKILKNLEFIFFKFASVRDFFM